jgi:hypothetical protein
VIHGGGQHFTGSELRHLARRTPDAKQARRLLALATIYDGGSRSKAARIGDVADHSRLGLPRVIAFKDGIAFIEAREGFHGLAEKVRQKGR